MKHLIPLISLRRSLVAVAAASAIGCVPNDYYGDIAFVRADSPVTTWGDLYVMGWDGTGVRQLTDSGTDAFPRWSPDKDKIAFNRRIGGRSGHWDIYLINPDGSGEEALVTGTQNDVTPAWSPDGTQLAFQSDRFGDLAIYTYDIARRTERRLDMPLGVGGPSHPSWSHDGEEIAFQGVGATSGIYTIDVDSDDWHFVVANGHEPDWYGKYQPNRGLITYRMGGDIRLINGDGTDPRVLGRGDLPKWSVDFKTVVFQRFSVPEGNDYDLYKSEIDGRTTRLTDNEGINDMHPHW